MTKKRSDTRISRKKLIDAQLAMHRRREFLLDTIIAKMETGQISNKVSALDALLESRHEALSVFRAEIEFAFSDKELDSMKSL